MTLKIVLIFISSVAFLFVVTMIRCIINSIKTIKKFDGGEGFFYAPINCVEHCNIAGGRVSKVFLCWHKVGVSGGSQFDNSVTISLLTAAAIFCLGVASIAISHIIFNYKWFFIGDMFIASLTFFCMSMSLFYYFTFGKRFMHDVLTVKDSCFFFGIFLLILAAVPSSILFLMCKSLPH